MDRRPLLQQMLKSLFTTTPYVYHNPPPNVVMKYPCIVYKMTGMPNNGADNRRYFEHREYQVTVIDPDPDSQLREKVALLKWCRFQRSFVSENLHHFIFVLNY